MLDKFGRSLLFLIGVVLFIMGAMMALKLAVPGIKKVSASLGDTIQGIVH